MPLFTKKESQQDCLSDSMDQIKSTFFFQEEGKLCYNTKCCTLATFLYYHMEYRAAWYLIPQYQQMNANDIQCPSMINL